MQDAVDLEDAVLLSLQLRSLTSMVQGHRYLGYLYMLACLSECIETIKHTHSIGNMSQTQM